MNPTGPPRLPPGVGQNTEQLKRLYKNAARAIEKELQDAALTSFRKFRLGQHKRQIEAIIAALNKGAVDLADKMIGPSYETGAKLSADALVEQGLEAAASGVDMGSRIHTAAVSAIADQMKLDLIAGNTGMGDAAIRILRRTQQKAIEEKQVQDMIAKGLVQGETRREVSERLAEKLKKELGDGMKLVVNGRKFDPDYYAELVARTMTREAVTAASVTTAGEFGVYLFQVSVHDNPCEAICAARQGKVYSTVDGAGFPTLDRRPPFHPNCRHVLVPYVPASDEEEEKLKKISKSRGLITSLPHYKEVLDGGKMKRAPKRT
jgi:SPP1 gp7 family putative phage head morphogenesis protein